MFKKIFLITIVVILLGSFGILALEAAVIDSLSKQIKLALHLI